MIQFLLCACVYRWASHSDNHANETHKVSMAKVLTKKVTNACAIAAVDIGEGEN